MALHNSNKNENIKASIDKYIFDNIFTTNGITVDWQGTDILDTNKLSEWIQPRIVRGGSEFCRQVSNSTKGNLNEILVNINIFLKKGATTNAHRLFELRDIVADYFQEDQVIGIYNYSGDSSFIDNAIVREIITDMEIPTMEELYFQYNYTPLLRLIQQF